MSLFLVTSEDLADAMAAATEYFTKLRVFVNPDLVPVGPALWLMEWTTAFELRRLTIKWSRTPATGVVQDHAMITQDFLNLTGGLPDASWTSADYAAVETAFDACWGSRKAEYPTSVALAEYNWRANGPAFKPFGASLSPTLRITTRSVAGTSSSQMLPPQVALTVTKVIPATFVAHDVLGVGDQTRNRWGRVYWPAPGVNNVFNGRVDNTIRTNLAADMATFYNACVAGGLIPVVYSPTTGHAWSIESIHVDDIWDVVRSRRYITPLQRTATAITQP